MTAPDFHDPNVALRRMVDDEAKCERERQEAEAQTARQHQAKEQAEADAAAQAEHQARQTVAVFLDAMRRAGNPGIEHYRLGAWKPVAWWRGQPGAKRFKLGRSATGWVLREPNPARFDGWSGLFLTTTGELYSISPAGPLDAVEPLHNWRLLVDQPLLAQCMVRHGVSP